MRSIRNLLLASLLFLGYTTPGSAQCNMLLLGAGTCGSAAVPIVLGNVTTVQDATPSGSPATVSFTPTSGTNRLLLVAIMFNDATATVSSVTFNGGALTNNSTLFRGNTTQSVVFYWVVAAAETTADVVVTMSADVNVQVGISSWTGVSQGTPVDTGTIAKNAYSFTNASSDVTSESGDIVVDALIFSAGANPAKDASQTHIWGDVAPSFFGWGGTYEAGAASVSMDWTTDTGTAAQVAMNLNKA